MTKEEFELKIIREFNHEVEAIESNYKIQTTSYSTTAENLINFINDNIIINYEKLRNVFIRIYDIKPIRRNNIDEKLTFTAILEIEVSYTTYQIVYKDLVCFE